MGIFFRRSRAANSAVGGRIRPNFKLLRALMHVIITCKYEKDRIYTTEKKWQHRFFHYNPICCHGNQSSNLAKFQTHPSSHVCHRSLQVWNGSDQEQPRKSGNTVFPIISIWGFFQTLKGSLLRSLWSDLAEFQTPPSSHACYHYLQVWKGSDKNSREKVATPFFPL